MPELEVREAREDPPACEAEEATAVLVLSDQLLAASLRTIEVEDIDFDAVEIDRLGLLQTAEVD